MSLGVKSSVACARRKKQGNKKTTVTSLQSQWPIPTTLLWNPGPQTPIFPLPNYHSSSRSKYCSQKALVLNSALFREKQKRRAKQRSRLDRPCWIVPKSSLKEYSQKESLAPELSELETVVQTMDGCFLEWQQCWTTPSAIQTDKGAILDYSARESSFSCRNNWWSDPGPVLPMVKRIWFLQEKSFFT